MSSWFSLQPVCKLPPSSKTVSSHPLFLSALLSEVAPLSSLFLLELDMSCLSMIHHFVCHSIRYFKRGRFLLQVLELKVCARTEPHQNYKQFFFFFSKDHSLGVQYDQISCNRTLKSFRRLLKEMEDQIDACISFGASCLQALSENQK